MSRINVKLKSDQESEINGMGPEITSQDVDKLFEKLEDLKQGDVLVLSGSIPSSIDRGIYERILSSLEDRGILAVVDAEKELLLNVLKYHPFLIKPNNHELGDMFGIILKSQEEIAEYARKLQHMGAGNVLVSMAGDGALLVTEDGQVHRMGVAEGTVKNSVGAGDSMVAGFLAGYLENGDYGHALRLGTAAGGATAFSDGLGTKDRIMELYEALGEV
jgi:1-phosphofructokinase